LCRVSGRLRAAILAGLVKNVGFRVDRSYRRGVYTRDTLSYSRRTLAPVPVLSARCLFFRQPDLRGGFAMGSLPEGVGLRGGRCEGAEVQRESVCGWGQTATSRRDLALDANRSLPTAGGRDVEIAGDVHGWHSFAEAVCRRHRKPQLDDQSRTGVDSILTPQDRCPVLRTQVVPTCATRAMSSYSRLVPRADVAEQSGEPPRHQEHQGLTLKHPCVGRPGVGHATRSGDRSQLRPLGYVSDSGRGPSSNTLLAADVS
jgi:hypothetical protein